MRKREYQHQDRRHVRELSYTNKKSGLTTLIHRCSQHQHQDRRHAAEGLCLMEEKRDQDGLKTIQSQTGLSGTLFLAVKLMDGIK